MAKTVGRRNIWAEDREQGAFRSRGCDRVRFHSVGEYHGAACVIVLVLRLEALAGRSCFHRGQQEHDNLFSAARSEKPPWAGPNLTDFGARPIPGAGRRSPRRLRRTFPARFSHRRHPLSELTRVSVPADRELQPAWPPQYAHIRRHRPRSSKGSRTGCREAPARYSGCQRFRSSWFPAIDVPFPLFGGLLFGVFRLPAGPAPERR